MPPSELTVLYTMLSCQQLEFASSEKGLLRRGWASSELEFSWEVIPDRLQRCKQDDGSDFRLG